MKLITVIEQSNYQINELNKSSFRFFGVTIRGWSWFKTKMAAKARRRFWKEVHRVY